MICVYGVFYLWRIIRYYLVIISGELEESVVKFLFIFYMFIGLLFSLFVVWMLFKVKKYLFVCCFVIIWCWIVVVVFGCWSEILFLFFFLNSVYYFFEGVLFLNEIFFFLVSVLVVCKKFCLLKFMFIFVCLVVFLRSCFFLFVVRIGVFLLIVFFLILLVIWLCNVDFGILYFLFVFSKDKKLFLILFIVVVMFFGDYFFFLEGYICNVLFYFVK